MIAYSTKVKILADEFVSQGFTLDSRDVMFSAGSRVVAMGNIGILKATSRQELSHDEMTVLCGLLNKYDFRLA